MHEELIILEVKWRHMIQDKSIIRDDSFVSDIVTQDYRTSGIFLKYGIDYCCGGKHALRDACELRGLKVEDIIEELQNAVHTANVSSSLEFNKWDIDFLIDYIEYVHHHSTRENLSIIDTMLTALSQGFPAKNPNMIELRDYFKGLRADLLPHLEEEENIIFPYIKQIAHAYKRKDSIGGLFVRTLRKPIENIIHHEEERLAQYLHRFRKLTNNYMPPAKASLELKACFTKLKELDKDLAQHIHLENNILFPKALAMEKELLRS